MRGVPHIPPPPPLLCSRIGSIPSTILYQPKIVTTKSVQSRSISVLLCMSLRRSARFPIQKSPSKNIFRYVYQESRQTCSNIAPEYIMGEAISVATLMESLSSLYWWTCLLLGMPAGSTRLLPWVSP